VAALLMSGVEQLGHAWSRQFNQLVTLQRLQLSFSGWSARPQASARRLVVLK
jgi:hypothetical protein